MRCPYCKQDHDKVIDTRLGEDGYVTRRRRECLNCSRRYTTHERLEEMPLRVIKKNNRRAPFDRDKIRAGILRSVEKRPVGQDMVETLVDQIESEILEHYDREITTTKIGEIVMEKLRDLDMVAYIRFASVYREFKEVGEFLREIDTIAKRGTESE